MFTLYWLSYLLPQTSIVDSLAVWKQTDALSSLIGQVLARYCALIGSWSERMYYRHLYAIKAEQANWNYVNLYVNYMTRVHHSVGKVTKSLQCYEKANIIIEFVASYCGPDSGLPHLLCLVAANVGNIFPVMTSGELEREREITRQNIFSPNFK